MKTIKAKVHMLPTEDFGCIYKRSSELTIHEPRLHKGEWTPQNLYITTDEEIKEGDWFINTGSGGHPAPKVYQANSENSKAFKEFGPYPEIRKIIATTDPKLLPRKEYDGLDESAQIQYRIIKGLPQIPQSFIEEYCKAGGIDEVLVEYIDVMPQLNGTRTDGKIIDEISLEPSLNTLSVPKLNQDNTIIIHPVEEKMYSRDEVEELCRDAFSLGQQWVHEITFTDKDPMTVNKWIEENL